MSDRNKPGVTFWTTVVVGAALLAYPLSFGPACWIAEGDRLPSFAHRALRRFYSPLANHAISECKSSPLAAMLWWWSCLAAENGAWNFQIDARLHLRPYHNPPYR